MASNPSAHLKIDSHVVVQLGTELISDAEQALLELVKNSYDGDAKWCRIHIEPNWLPEETHPWFDHFQLNKISVGRIRVRDNGTGLSEGSVLNGWLTISASKKRASDNGVKPKTELGRVPVGDKGLGRLATMRLGDVLQLRTMIAGEKFSRRTSFAWSAFHSGVPLEEVPVRQGSFEPFTKRKSGTDVEVIGLNEVAYWRDAKNIKNVVSTLSVLISPFRQFKDFKVIIEDESDKFDLQDIASESLNHASAKFKISFAENRLSMTAWFARSLFRGAKGSKGQELYDELLSASGLPDAISFFAEHKRMGKRNFKSCVDRPGGWLFSVSDSLDWDDIPQDPKLPRAQNPGPIEAEIYYFLFSDETRQKLVAAQVDIETIQNMASVGVFRDGFRVRMGDDWLGLSEGTTSGGFYQLRPKNVVGFFSISNEFNPRMVEKSDREGFVDNESWRGFMLVAQRARKFANDSLETVRGVYNEFAKKKRIGSGEPVIGDDDSVAFSQAQAHAVVSRLERETASLREVMGRSLNLLNAAPTRESLRERPRIGLPLEEVRKELASTLASVQDTSDVQFQTISRLVDKTLALQEQNTRLVEAAAVGLSARTLAHEIATYVNQIERGIRSASRAQKQGDDAAFTSAVLGISGAIRELKKVVATIDPLLPGSRSIKNTFSLRAGVEAFFELKKRRLDDAGVTFSLQGNEGQRIRFAETRFNQILENLLQNSLFWLNMDRQKNRDRRAITVDIHNSTLTWFDNGKGIREAVEDTLFDAYVTDKPVSEGRGLGLFIVTAFLHSEKCDITLGRERNELGRRYKFKVDFSGALVNA